MTGWCGRKAPSCRRSRVCKNVLASPLYVMTNTTMLRTNVHTLPATLDFLAELGVPTIGLNALDPCRPRGARWGQGWPSPS